MPYQTAAYASPKRSPLTRWAIIPSGRASARRRRSIEPRISGISIRVIPIPSAIRISIDIAATPAAPPTTPCHAW